jgi:hypothetical protein
LQALIATLPPSLRGQGLVDGSAPATAAKQNRPSTAASAMPPPNAIAADSGGGSAPLERIPSPLPTPALWLAWTLSGTFGELGPTELRTLYETERLLDERAKYRGRCARRRRRA